MDESDIAGLSDDDLLAAFASADGEGADAEALLAEIQRRGLDV